MDKWEAVLKSCQDENDQRIFAKVLRSADIVLAEDLTPFETEWILSTLLHKPVHLLQVVTNRRTDNGWDTCVRDTLKLLASIVDKYASADKYYDEIVQLCLLHYEPLVRQQALSCLSRVASKSVEGARNFTRHVSALEESTTCKAPLAVLVGTICEHHPSAVEDEITRIWRVYLNLLDSNKYSVTVIKSVLEGISGLFKHFGMELPMLELNVFYNKLVTYLDLSRCEDVTLKFLQKYANLFRERISSDKCARTLLWKCNSMSARPAILATYGVVLDTVTDVDTVKNILETEIHPRTSRSTRFYERFTALRVLTDAHARKIAGACDLSEHVDLQELEFRLRAGNVDYETCEAVSWCVQSKLPFSERLLQAAILVYDRFPAKKGKGVVVHSLLQSDKEVRTSITSFLIAESIRPSTKENCAKMWRDIFDTDNNTDNIVLENSIYVLDEVLGYIKHVVENFLEADGNPLPDAMPQLFSLLLTVLRLNSASDLLCSLLARALRECARTHTQSVPAAICCGLYAGEVYEDLHLDICSDEEMLLQFALVLLEMPDHIAGKCLPRDMVLALQIIFSNTATDSSVQSKAVLLLDKLLQENSVSMKEQTQLMQKVLKLSQRIGKTSKGDRILHWDVVMFLGKYGKHWDLDDEASNSDNVLIYKLKDALMLDVPHHEGILKLNLQEVLYSAIKREESSALNMLLTVITATMTTRKDPERVLQTALLRVLVSLSHFEIDDDVIRAAVSLCDGVCANELIKYTEGEKARRSRKTLLKASAVMLEADGAILENILDYVIPNEIYFTNQSHSDIAEFLLNQLKENNALCQKYLRIIIAKILYSEIRGDNLMKMASNLFVDKIGLFSATDIKDFINNIFKILISSGTRNATKCIIALEFVKRILDTKNDVLNTEEVFDLFLSKVAKEGKKINLRIFMAVTKVFGVAKERVKEAFLDNNFLKQIMERGYYASQTDHHDYFDMETQFDFYCEYYDVLRQIDDDYHIEMATLTPENVIKFDKNLSKCVSLTKIPVWFEDQPIREITQDIEKYSFEENHDVLHALRIMVNVWWKERPAPISMEFTRDMKRWADWISKLNASGYVERNLKSKMAFLMDVVEVSFKFMSDEDVAALVREDKKNGLKFIRDFMPAVYDRLVKRPYVLMEPCMEDCCTVLNDVVRCAVRRIRREDVIELVNSLWPRYEQHSTMDEKQSLLLDLCPLSPDGNAGRWAVLAIGSGGTKLDDKIRLLQVLRLDGEYSALHKLLCPHLPARLSELSGLASCCFRSLLDALADASDTHADTSDTLLDIVATLAASDGTKGWWDDAIDACMSAVAKKADVRTYRAVFARCFEGRGLGACTRLMLPLLRYSTTSLCEEFFSKVLEELLNVLKKKPRDVSAHYSYEKCLLEYVLAFYMLEVVFQKVPKDHIQSPRSMLYSEMSVGDTPSYIVSTVCKLCVTLRNSVKCPPEADDNMRKSFRLFHCVNYNALASAICCTQMKSQILATVFNQTTWDTLIGDEEIQLPLSPQWNQRNTRQAVSIEVAGELLSLRTSATLNTVRTPAFMRTLSENVFQYDLLEEEDQAPAQNIQLTDNALNRHECAGTLTALLSRVSTLEGVNWRDALVATLVGNARANVKWLLAQAIYNSKEDLKPHASALRPALLAVIVSTAKDNKLNGLHIDIVDTLIFWNEAAEPSSNLNSTIDCIITTAIDHRLNKSLYYMLVEKLTKMSHQSVTINWSFFENRLAEPNSDTAKYYIDILKRVLQCNVYIPELLPALTATLANVRAMSELTTLFALAMAAARDRGEGEGELLNRYRKVLERLRRSDHGEYIKLLREAQKGFPGCCDETHFRSITDLTPKVSGRPKLQCLEILAAYVTDARRCERVAAMFDTVGLLEMTTTREALTLIRNGLHLMEEHLRTRIVSQVAGICQQLPVKVRSVAYGVLVKALQLLLSPEPKEPVAKRRARESNSLLLTLSDTYTENVLTGVAQGLVDGDGDISKSVREGVGGCLSEDCGVRLCECFLLAVVVPLKNTSRLPDGSNLAAMLDLFFQRVRDQEVFQKAKLRDDPLELRPIISATASSSTLGNQRGAKQDSSTVGVNVQMPMDEILKSFLLLLQKDPTAATSVTIQLIKAYKTQRPGFDFESTMSGNIFKCLSTMSCLTPCILSIARHVDIWDSSNLEEIINVLVRKTRNTEGEDICKLLLEDYRIRVHGPELFLMGITDDDVDMFEALPEFSLKDLTSCFGKLSNWEDLTSREKRSVKSALPALWSSQHNFEADIQDYDLTDCPTWVNAMVSAYRNTEQHTFKWITEMDTWPRKPFDISALMETTIWDSIRDTCDVKQYMLPAQIHPSDCLAEWAFRIMLRSSYLKSLKEGSNEELDKLSHSHELLWCARASEIGLHAQALECCKHVTGLYESETMKWLRQKVLARRAIALERNDSESLKSTLNFAEQYAKQFAAKSCFEDVLGMNEVMLRLKRDVKSLQQVDIEKIRTEISSKLRTKELEPDMLSKLSKKHLDSIFVTAMSYYNGIWDSYTCTTKCDLLKYMLRILELFAKLDLGDKEKLLADIIIDRLDDVSLDSNMARELLDVFKLVSHQLDGISIGQLTSVLDKCTEHRDELKEISDEAGMGKYRRCLSLLCDPEYQLLQYCRNLGCALEREDYAEWSRVYANMMAAIFKNPYAGPDYEVLYKYKNALDDIADEDTSGELKRQVLSSIQSQLKGTPKDTVSLSNLCPALAHGLEGDENLARLLCLKRGVYVAKFEEKISVFVDSIRRPTLVRCRLTDGTLVRYIVKSGERIRPHCAALRLLTTVQAGSTRRVNTGYHVTPLSEDCGLIHYLEDHERLKELVSSTCSAVDSLVATVHRSKDSELILAPTSSLQQFELLCAKVPAYLLRSAIESRCVNTQDFIAKKKNFLESLCDMTILSCLYGIGDRHLENMMYSIQDGGACHVDCGAILQYGGGELPPARLTRNVLAVCDFTVIESRLQGILACIRDSSELLVPAVTVSFKWMKDQELMKKLHHVKNLMLGSTLSHKVTVEELSKSNRNYKDKYIELLEDVFADFADKQTYSIEEQVSNLLRQSTEPRILSVTRSGWEPWI